MKLFSPALDRRLSSTSSPLVIHLFPYLFSKVADAAVFGAPNEEMGEEVKAVVQLMPGFEPGVETEAELIGFCRERLAHHKCPRSVDFEAELPRLPTGKLYNCPLRERYWKGHKSRIL